MAVRDDADAPSDLPDNLRAAARGDRGARCRTAAPTTAAANDRGAWHDRRRRASTAWAELEPGYDAHRRRSTRSSATRNDVDAPRHARHAATTSSRSASTRRTRVWVMLHSGSRGVGNRIGTLLHRAGARQDMRRWHVNLPDQDLAYLTEGTRALRRLRRGGRAGRRSSRATTAS